MSGFILIDGAAFWTVFGLFVFLTIFTLIMQYSILKENDELKKQNTALKCELNRVREKLYKATFTVPEISEMETKKGKEKNGRK